MWCHNLSLGLTTKVKVCKGVGREWRPRVAFHAPENVGGCERMNPHTPKWALTLGVRVPMNSQIFKEWLQRSNLIELNIFLYHWKVLGKKMFKMGSHIPFKYFKHKLWPKERSRIKLSIWFPTTKSRELPWFTCMQVMCHILLASSWRGLQILFKPHFNRRSAQNVMGIPGQNDIWV
jgi:hypothetical protein